MKTSKKESKNSKLTLNKATITILNRNHLIKIQGGGNDGHIKTGDKTVSDPTTSGGGN